MCAASTLAFVEQIDQEWQRERACVVLLQDQPQRGRVLLIDDEAFIIAALRRLLSGEHDVTAVMSVPEAIALIEAGQSFDVILCDVRMPGLSGLDFYERLGTLAPELTKRIVFCTGATFSHDTREFFARVQNPVLEKPFDPGSVRLLVRGFVEKIRADVSA